ncbi:MAG: hypothetical protein JWQ96_1524, partial [Segetibacter sp.]|nr:hypothetical protein [Segetibacter sp.]
IWLAFSIYRQIVNRPNWEESLLHIKASVLGGQGWKLVLVVLLMFANWSIEALKWKVLIQHIQPMRFSRALKAILSGLSVSVALNTPNGIGEYVGRVIYIKEGNRIRAVTLTFVGSISQLIVTVLFGCIGMLVLQNLFEDKTNHGGFSAIWVNATIYASMAFTVVLLIFYFKLGLLVKLAEKLPFVVKYMYFIQKLEEFETKELVRVLLLSFLRYSIFIIQYVLLLQLFEVNIDWWESCWLTSVMFLALAIVPTIALAEVGLRAQLSISLFGLISNNTLGIVFTATGIWLINLVVPALAGSLFVLGFKLFRSK